MRNVNFHLLIAPHPSFHSLPSIFLSPVFSHHIFYAITYLFIIIVEKNPYPAPREDIDIWKLRMSIVVDVHLDFLGKLAKYEFFANLDRAVSGSHLGPIYQFGRLVRPNECLPNTLLRLTPKRNTSGTVFISSYALNSKSNKI